MQLATSILVRTTTVLALACPAASFAQYSAVDYNVQYEQAYNNMQVSNSVFMNQQIAMSQNAAASVQRASRQASKSGASSSSGLGVPISGAKATPEAGSTVLDLTYAPSSKISEEMEQAFIQHIAKVDQAAADSVAADLKKQDGISRIAGDIGPYGLSVKDLGDAATAYWVVMWMAANKAELPTKNQVLAVREQVRAQYAADPSMGKGGDAQRQRLAEVYLYESLLMISIRNKASTRSEKQQVADTAAKKMRDQGLDIRSMKLTDSGFVKA